MSELIKIAKLSDLPEDAGKLVSVDGEEVALFKVGERVYAVHAVCPHQGGPLQEGGIHEGKVMCPWHGWEFNLQTGQCDFNPKICIPTYKVHVDGDDVFVEI